MKCPKCGRVTDYKGSINYQCCDCNTIIDMPKYNEYQARLDKVLAKLEELEGS